jgi:plasmid stabilization system protein ParE
MVNKIEVSPLAEKEIEESFNWYEKEAEGLGIRFILSIDEAINNISEKPEAYPKKKSNIRQCVVDVFPFVVVFEYLKADSLINILHVFHTSRNPKLRYKRKS